MKQQRMIEVIAESYEEEQYLLNELDEAWWEDRKGNIVFTLPESKEDLVMKVIKEWKDRKKK
jgi:hypothetical protein